MKASIKLKLEATPARDSGTGGRGGCQFNLQTSGRDTAVETDDRRFETIANALNPSQPAQTFPRGTNLLLGNWMLGCPLVALLAGRTLSEFQALELDAVGANLRKLVMRLLREPGGSAAAEDLG